MAPGAAALGAALWMRGAGMGSVPLCRAGQMSCSALGSCGSAVDEGTARMSLPNTVILGTAGPFWGHKTCFCMLAVRLGEQIQPKQG